MHGQEIASLLPRELGDVFYKTATVQARSGDEVMGGRPAQVRDDEGGAGAGAASDAVDAVAPRASERLIAGRIVVSRRASPDFPFSGSPRRMQHNQCLVIVRERPLSN
jgi:hypothetical protein